MTALVPRSRFFRLLLAVSLLFCGCDNSRSPSPKSDESSLTKVTLELNWYPEVEHGGFYAALVHGYYKAEGLDVEIRPGGPESPVVQDVADGRSAFGVVNADVLLFGRAQQAPVVALLAPLQTSPRCLIVHEASGIRTFDQLQNMTIAMSTTQAFYFYLQMKVPLKNVQVVPYAGSVERFLTDANYAQQGYVFSEPFLIRENGGDPRNLMLADLGFNPYTSLLFTSETVIAEQPKVVQKMVAATARGWRHYLREPSDTNAYIEKLNPAMDQKILAFGAKEIQPLVLGNPPNNENLGTMTLTRWQTLTDQLVECKQLKPNTVKASEAFTMKFLTEKPESGK